MTQPLTSAPEFFEEKYLADEDPWRFASAPYEQGRYRHILDALGTGSHFRRALEPGCSVGALTEQLATLCGHLDAFDFSPTAIARAEARCQALGNVHLSVASLAPGMPWGQYDLLLFSEVGYYFTADAWLALVDDISRHAEPGTTWLLCHWLGHSPDHQLTGDHVHAVVEDHPAWRLALRDRHPGFRLSRLVRA